MKSSLRHESFRMELDRSGDFIETYTIYVDQGSSYLFGATHCCSLISAKKWLDWYEKQGYDCFLVKERHEVVFGKKKLLKETRSF